MAQLLRAWAAPAEDLGSGPTTTERIAAICYSSFTGPNTLYWPPQAIDIHMVQRHTCRQNICIK